MIKNIFPKLILFPFLICFLTAHTQMITGVWKGKINRQKVEVKIIQTGDTLVGTSYYYESANNYRRYSIKGYFDAHSNEVIWWDDQLIEEKSQKISLTSPGKDPLIASADFNCPDGKIMKLDGKAALKDNYNKPQGEVALSKNGKTIFEDEWNFVIDNYTVGANDPDIIDSIMLISKRPVAIVKPVAEKPAIKPVVIASPPVAIVSPTVATETVQKPVQKMEPPKEIIKPVVKIAEPAKQPTIEEKFVSRKKILTTEIPVTGDSIELRFYDNAEVDGDSISLFLNDKLIFQHIRLMGYAYVIKLSVADLKETNELIMVAENMGSIPPNTSYMVVMVGDKKYDARLESTEGSSAMVRFIKKH